MRSPAHSSSARLRRSCSHCLPQCTVSCPDAVQRLQNDPPGRLVVRFSNTELRRKRRVAWLPLLLLFATSPAKHSAAAKQGVLPLIAVVILALGALA